MAMHRIIKSKMIKTEPLQNDPILRKHVPETVWFREKELSRMLDTYSTVYVKPDKGRKGIGIVRLKRLSSSTCELSSEQGSQQLSFSKAVRELRSQFDPRKSYLIQQGIDLATYQKCPFHIRLVLQKPFNRWRLSLTSALVGKDEHAVVTNVSRGNQEFSVEHVLLRNDQNLNPLATFRELIDVSHQIATVLASKLPLLVVGLDMGIDKNGKIWFIEANTKPDCVGMQAFNDAKSYDKYLQAKKWLRKYM
jgi:YheC/D like ATP-grasp